MRYLILAAGMGRRLGGAGTTIPKCLIDVGGEPLLGRLLRQIRQADPGADVDVVTGYRADAVAPLLAGCRVVVNPFFDITGINASLWFARESFDRPLAVIHGDLVLSDELASELFAAEAESLIAYDSGILDPREINVAVTDGRITRFGVNFRAYSGAYAGVIKLGERAASLFSATLDRRVRRGFNEARTYYFFVVRTLIDDYGVAFQPFDFAGYAWKEIDYPDDIDVARRLVGGGDVAAER
jgi:choline kinase